MEILITVFKDRKVLKRAEENSVVPVHDGWDRSCCRQEMQWGCEGNCCEGGAVKHCTDAPAGLQSSLGVCSRFGLG